MKCTILNRIGLGLISIAAIAVTSLTLPTAAWSMAERPVISDPDDPAFDPLEFRFRNYAKSKGTSQQLPGALLKAFPPGTERSVIEKVLLDKNNVKLGQTSHSDHAIYLWLIQGGLAGHNVNVIYNGNGQSVYLSLNGSRLYGQNKYKSAAVREHIQALKPEKLIQMEQEQESRLKILREKYLGSQNGDVDENNPNGKVRP